jgi:two-component system, NarL family, sensor kinase
MRAKYTGGMTERGLTALYLEHSSCVGWVIDSGSRVCRTYGDLSVILGKPAAELRGRTLAEALDPAAAALWDRRMARALAGESLFLRHRKRSTEWAVLVFSFEFGGAPHGGVLARELTDWLDAERTMREKILGALEAQEFERRMAAQFLHDKIGQNLTALGLQLDLVRMDLQPSAPGAAARISEVQKLLEEVMEEVRRYSYDLNPSMVERAGLRSALDRLASSVRDRFRGVVRVNADPSLRIETSLALGLYNIARTAVENAVQHAGCSVIEIAVKSTGAGPCLEVRDNGKGFDPADIMGRRGLGLLTMEHHAARVGLELSFQSAGRSGAVVRAAFPEG